MARGRQPTERRRPSDCAWRSRIEQRDLDYLTRISRHVRSINPSLRFVLILPSFLKRLSSWERRHLPGNNLSAARYLLVWLSISPDQERPLKELYFSSPFSQPTCREAILAFKNEQLVYLRQSDGDARVRVIAATSKLRKMARGYAVLFAKAGFIHTTRHFIHRRKEL